MTLHANRTALSLSSLRAVEGREIELEESSTDEAIVRVVKEVRVESPTDGKVVRSDDGDRV